MRVRGVLSVGTFALATAIAVPAYAQNNPAPQAAADTEAAAPDIVVTAQFRATKLQDTPIAITAVNGDMLAQRGQTDIAQVAAQAPNVTLTPQPQLGGIGLIAFIRGIGQTDFDYALDPGVGVYVDDVYIPTLSSSLLNLMDVDRVEILRGPQGTLAGKNSIGGAIKLYSQKPQGSDKGYLEAGYGSFNEINVRGMADFAVTKNLAVRISGVSTSHDGWIDMVDYGLSHPTSNVPGNNTRGGNYVVGKEGSQNMTAGRIALRWQPTSNLDINLSGDYTSEHDSPGPEVLVAAGAISSTAAAFNPRSADPATNANGGAWLPGKNGAPVPVDCHFVPYGRYGCDTPPAGVNPKYMTYANFLDGMAPTSQAPYKPYAALQDNDYVGWGLNGNVQLNLSDLANITWISSYREYQSNFSQDQDATPVPVAQLDNQLNHSAWSQELRINGSLGNKLLEYTAGGFIMHQDAKYTARVDLNYAGIDFLHGPDTTPSTSKALFLNATLHPTSAWSISGGIRESWDKKVYTYFRRDPDGTIPFGNWTPAQLPVLPICEALQGLPTSNPSPTSIGNTPNCLLTGLYNVSGTFQGSRTDWRVETDYRFSDAVMTYASVATGYMGGGINPRPFFGPSAGDCNAAGYVAPAPCNQIKPFNPETLTTYEVGFKTDLFDRKLRLNGAFFYNKFNDIILTLSACPSIPCLQPNNVGKADVKGFELETTIRPTKGLTFDGSLSYIDFKYTDTGKSGVPLTAVSPYTPKWTWSVGGQYDYMMANDSTLGIRLDGDYRSEIYSEAFNTDWGAIKGRFLGNARIYFKSPEDKWQISLEVKNLFDNYYFQTKSDITTSLGLVTGQPGMPRTWLASIRRNF